MKIKRENVIVGTLLLSASSIFVRMIGFVFRIYLAGKMGAEGIGVYSLIMSVYALCSTVATSGISTAVSKLAAEHLAFGHRANAKRVLKRAVTLSAGISLCVGLAVLLLADFIAGNVLGDARTALSLKLLAPGMPFLAISASVRGYFIAERHMGNPASGQVLEQLFKMGFIILLIDRAMPLGLEYGCALVILGMTLGEALCLVYTLAGYLLERRRQGPMGRPTVRGATRSILRVAVPISVGSYIRSALRLVEDVLVVSGFRAFSGQADVATGTYGMLKGMVMPLLVFPLSLLSAFVVTLTPEISRLDAQGSPARMERAIDMVLRYTAIIGIFIVGVFMTFSYELGVAVYKDAQVGAMLGQMAFLVPFMCVEMVVVGILQGLGEQVSSLRYNVLDCVLRIALVYLLIPVRGVQGFVVMIVASNLFTSVLNLRRLFKTTHIRMRWREWVLAPALGTLVAGQVCRVLINYGVLPPLGLVPELAVGLGLMGVIYLVALLCTGCVKKGDWAWILQRLRISSSKPPKTEMELDT